MSELNVRIKQKIDTTANWEASSIILELGEVGIEQKTLSDSKVAFLVKVGNGVDTWGNLPYIQAVAADVYSWAKQAEKPTYAATEITGLGDFVRETVVDTNTQYKFSIAPGTGEDVNFNIITILKKDLTDDDYVAYETIKVPFTDISGKADKTEAIASIVNAANAGTLTLTKADGTTASDLKLAGVVTTPTYNAETRTLTLPYYGTDGTSQSVVMALGKDAVVTSGTYNAETKNIVLTLSTGETVNVPAADLVDVYTGATSNSITTTVSSDNVITSEVRVSSNVNNALTVRTVEGEEGLFVEATEFGEATESEAGMMSAEDKAKLDAIEANAQVNIIEAVKFNGTALEVDDADKSVNIVLTEATTSAAGLMSASDKTKLDGVATGANVNVLEGVQVNGVDLSIDGNKKVNLVNATTTTAGLMSASDKTKIDGLEDALNGKVSTVTAGNNSITVAGTTTNPTVAVKVSTVEGNQLEVKEDGLYIDIPAVPEYTVVKAENAEEGYISTYYLAKDGTQVGASINIPKDFLVKGCSVEEVTENDKPYTGAVIGDKYLDFVINVKVGTATEEHLYIPVNDLVDVYTGGNGIEVSATNVITAKVVAANGLSVGAEGIKMAVATTTTAGAMTASDKSKLDGIAEGANVNKIETVKVAGTEVVAENKEVNITSIPVTVLDNVEGDTLVISCGTATNVL